jgi:hypothetical protein
MNYESFMNQKNRLNNLYNVVRKSDRKTIIRGASYNNVLNVIGACGENAHLYEIYFY